MAKQFAPVSCTYGAPMGRSTFGTPTDCAPRTVRVFKVRLSDGYDDGGFSCTQHAGSVMHHNPGDLPPPAGLGRNFLHLAECHAVIRLVFKSHHRFSGSLVPHISDEYLYPARTRVGNGAHTVHQIQGGIVNLYLKRHDITGLATAHWSNNGDFIAGPEYYRPGHIF